MEVERMMPELAPSLPVDLFPRRQALRRAEAADAPSDPSDEFIALVQRAQGGDLSAQRDLIMAYQRRMAGFVYAITGRTLDVEDLCQKVFIRMVRGVSSLRDATQFEPWLFRIGRHICIDEIRRRKTRVNVTPLVAAHTEVPEPSVRVDSEELDALRYALAQLNEEDRALVAMLQEGRSNKEISEAIGVNATATKSRCHRARLRLREHYHSRH